MRAKAFEKEDPNQVAQDLQQIGSSLFPSLPADSGPLPDGLLPAADIPGYDMASSDGWRYTLGGLQYEIVAGSIVVDGREVPDAALERTGDLGNVLWSVQDSAAAQLFSGVTDRLTILRQRVDGTLLLSLDSGKQYIFDPTSLTLSVAS